MTIEREPVSGGECGKVDARSLRPVTKAAELKLLPRPRACRASLCLGCIPHHLKVVHTARRSPIILLAIAVKSSDTIF